MWYHAPNFGNRGSIGQVARASPSSAPFSPLRAAAPERRDARYLDYRRGTPAPDHACVVREPGLTDPCLRAQMHSSNQAAANAARKANAISPEERRRRDRDAARERRREITARIRGASSSVVKPTPAFLPAAGSGAPPAPSAPFLQPCPVCHPGAEGAGVVLPRFSTSWHA